MLVPQTRLSLGAVVLGDLRSALSPSVTHIERDDRRNSSLTCHSFVTAPHAMPCHDSLLFRILHFTFIFSTYPSPQMQSFTCLYSFSDIVMGHLGDQPSDLVSMTCYYYPFSPSIFSCIVRIPPSHCSRAGPGDVAVVRPPFVASQMLSDALWTIFPRCLLLLLIPIIIRYRQNGRHHLGSAKKGRERETGR